MLITPRKTDILDTLPSEIVSTPKRPLRDRSLSLSPSGSSPRGKTPSPEKGVTFSATSFYKPKSEYLNPFERMVVGKPKIYVAESVLKPQNKSSKVKPNVIGKRHATPRNSHKPHPSKASKSSAKLKQVDKSSKRVSSALASPETSLKQNEKPINQKSPLNTDSETSVGHLQSNSSEVEKDSKENTPTKRKSPRKSASPGKRTSPRKSPRKKKFFVTRSPTRDRKRWMGEAYAKTNFTLDFNKMSKLTKRSSPKSETKKQIQLDQTSEKLVTPNRPKKVLRSSSANTPTTSRSEQSVTPNTTDMVQNSTEENHTTPTKRRKMENSANTPATGSRMQPVTLNAKAMVHNSPTEKLATPIKQRKLEGNSSASSSKSLVRGAKSSEVDSILSNNADECSFGVAGSGTSLSEDLPVLVHSKKPVTPSKDDGASSLSPSRCYPIFEVNEKSKAKSPNVQQSPQRSSPRKKSNKFMKSNGTDQMIIDAGQRDLGARQCPSCNMVYSVGEAEDEMIHSKYHEEFFSILRFPGWKKERVVGQFTNGRVIKVLPSDPAFMMRKVEEVRALVDRDLGFCVFSLPQNPDSAFFFYVTLDKKIVGCVIAETITKAFRVLSSSDTPNSPPQTTKGWYCCTQPSKALCGISRVWTEPIHRRQKVATRIIDCLRGHFIYGQVLTVDDIAFSDPTPAGKEFATKYTDTETFLVYK